MNKNHLLIILGLIILFWILSGVVALNQNWVKPGVFGDMFGSINALFSGLALFGVIYTISLQREEIKNEKAERELKENRRKIQIMPDPKFGAKRIQDGTSDKHLMEITVNDIEEKMKNLRVIPISKIFDGLNIGEKGQKCKSHYQYRIAARVPNDQKGQFKLSYEDVDGNIYSKIISWPSMSITNID